MEINLLLFEGFETLDAFGPAEVFGQLPGTTLHCCSLAGGPVVSAQGVTVLTQPLSQVNRQAVLLLPGGPGTRALAGDSHFVVALREVAAKAGWCLTVCTGSALLARTALLDGHRATSNKKAMDWAKFVGPHVRWVTKARWVQDEKFYTSSGISAGMDMALAFVADRLGNEAAEAAANQMEYLWNRDSTQDPFGQGDEPQ